MMSSCFFCPEPESGRCPDCEHGTWCGPHHRAFHRNSRGECQPFQLKVRPGIGRYLEAARDIKPFELVLENRCVAWGTYDDGKPCCLECLGDLDQGDEETLCCGHCNLPLCSKCLGAGTLESHLPECLILRRHSPEKLRVEVRKGPSSPGEAVAPHPVGALIAPLRIFQLQNREATVEAFRTIMGLEAHLEEQRKDASRWGWVREALLPILRGCGLSPDEVETVERIVAIVRTNCASLAHRLDHGGESRGYGVYPEFSMINHSCVANCRFAADPARGHLMEVRAMRPIRKGEEITIQYVSPTAGTAARQAHLFKQWKFRCSCARCLDPTEFGTYLQAIRCRVCSQDRQEVGFLLPEADDSGTWTCRGGCGSSVATLEAASFTSRILEQTEKVRYERPLEDWERLLDEVQSRHLHPNHHICMNIKRVLIQLYGNRTKFADLPDPVDQIERKLELCQNYLDVYSKVDDGFTSWKGRLLEEMSGPSLLLQNIKFKAGHISRAEYLEAYRDSLRMVKVAAKCRQFEPHDSTTFLAWCLKECNDASSG